MEPVAPAPVGALPQRPRRDAAARWPAGPHKPALATGELHVWFADLAAAPHGVTHSLSADERARAARFLDERRRRLWARSRGVLRDLLGRYLECEPGALAFQTEAHGKPSLAAPQSAPAIVFNLSHSGALALYAFAHAGELGVDVQAPSRRGDPVALARSAFGERQAQRLQVSPPHARARDFARMWVRHEALRKCSGGGIWNQAYEGEHTATHTPWLADLDLGAQAPGAVCWQRVPRELRCWTWSG